MIKVHGWQVAPAEVEAVLLTHPQVINAAVIGIPLKDGTGEVPQAFVVLKRTALDGTYASHGELEVCETTEEDLQRYVAARLAKYKALQGVIFVDDIPRTASGKLQKVQLRELYASLTTTLKRKRSEIETEEEPNEVKGTRQVETNRRIDVLTPENPHRGHVNQADTEDFHGYVLRSKRVQVQRRQKVNRSLSSARGELMTDNRNDEQGHCVL